jgi:hypothetical protein
MKPSGLTILRFVAPKNPPLCKLHTDNVKIMPWPRFQPFRTIRDSRLRICSQIVCVMKIKHISTAGAYDPSAFFWVRYPADGLKCWPSIAFLAPKLTRQFGTPNASIQMRGRETRETPLPALCGTCDPMSS